MAKQVFCYNGTYNSTSPLTLHTVTAGRRAKVYLSYISLYVSGGSCSLYAGSVPMASHYNASGGSSATFPIIGTVGANNAPVGENVLIGATSTNTYVSALASAHLAAGQTVRLESNGWSPNFTYSICVVEEY